MEKKISIQCLAVAMKRRMTHKEFEIEPMTLFRLPSLAEVRAARESKRYTFALLDAAALVERVHFARILAGEEVADWMVFADFEREALRQMALMYRFTGAVEFIPEIHLPIPRTSAAFRVIGASLERFALTAQAYLEAREHRIARASLLRVLAAHASREIASRMASEAMDALFAEGERSR
jgi:hypothetical protein